MESYIRPGCIVLTIYLRQSEAMWEEVSFVLLKLVACVRGCLFLLSGTTLDLTSLVYFVTALL